MSFLSSSREIEDYQYEQTDIEQQTTFMLIKPDGVQRGLIGKMISKIQKIGLKIAALKLQQASISTIQQHYSKHTKQPYFPGLVKYMTSGPVVAIAWKGSNAVSLVRKNITVESRDVKMGTIRGNFAMHSMHYHKNNNTKLPAKNVCHASENMQEAKNEIKIWFPQLNDS